MTENDDDGNFDTPSNTPFQTPRPATSDYSGRVNKQIDLDGLDYINMMNRQRQELDRIKQETSQHLSELQPNIPEDPEASDLTRDLFKIFV